MFTNIFSSFIYERILDVDNISIIKVCKEELKNPSDHNQVNLPKHNTLKPLMHLVYDHVKLVSGQMGYGEKVMPMCVETWINSNAAKEIVKPHLHANAELACVYYALADENTDKIEFLNPVQQIQYIIKPKKVMNWNEYNSVTWTIKPQINKLIIFPAWLLHYVVGNNISDRISIAFNFKLL